MVIGGLRSIARPLEMEIDIFFVVVNNDISRGEGSGVWTFPYFKIFTLKPPKDNIS